MRAVVLVMALLGSGCEFVVEGLPSDDGASAPDLAANDGPPPMIDLAASDAAPPDFTMPPPDLAVIAHSCTEVLQAMPGAPSGLYTISPGGTALSVYCDMTHDGGGWTLLMRTVYDYTQTSALISGYSGFYGATVGTPAPGQAYRLAAQYWPPLNATGGHLVIHTPRGTDTKDCGKLFYRGTGASWVVAAPPGNATIGTVTSTVTLFNSMTLSTDDVGPAQGCVTSLACVPWPLSFCCDTCPSYGNGGVGHPGLTYYATGDENGNTAESICTNGLEFGDGIAHDNVFEYYVR